MRIIGLDYGTKTVGVAVSDSLGITAQAVETITRKEENKLRQTLARIEALIDEYNVEEIVVGLPKNMNNTIGERAEACRDFADKLEAATIKTIEDGKMTKDLALITTLENPTVLNSENFIKAIR